MAYIMFIDGIVWTPKAVNMNVREAWMLMVIKESMFSLSKNEDIKTYPTAPIARTVVHDKIETVQFAPNLHKVPIVNPTIPCLSR